MESARPVNPFRQFDRKVDAYIRHRWSYAPEAIETIFERAPLGIASTVVDMAAGPGTLAQPFVGRVGEVWAIEPNAEMREVAEQLLGHESTFRSASGLSHETGLPAHAVDLILVGRALHWFDPTPTRQEFLRILKPGGWLAVLQTPCTNPELLNAIAKLRREYYGWSIKTDKHNRTKTPAAFFFGHEQFETLMFSTIVEETWLDFLGRLVSFSPAPGKAHPLRSRFEAGAREIFEQFKEGDRLYIPMATELKLGQVRST
ncbi:MAG: class I SAM-dependent methyltransferase [Cyanobacteria bacterium P01_H01_bin.15]